VISSLASEIFYNKKGFKKQHSWREKKEQNSISVISFSSCRSGGSHDIGIKSSNDSNES
jgi:hypothetical protein